MSRSRWTALIFGWGALLLVLIVVVPVHAQGGPFTAQIENFWRLIATGGRTFTNINVTGGTITGVAGLGGNITGVSGSLLPPTTPLNGFTLTPVSQVKFTTVGAPEAANRTTNFFSYMTLPAASSATKAGMVAMVDVPNTNDGAMSGSARAIWNTVDLYGPTSHQYAGSVVGVQTNVGLHNTGGAVNVFGTFTQALNDTTGASVGGMRGAYIEATNNGTGGMTSQYGTDTEVLVGAGAHTINGWGLYTQAAVSATGALDNSYGVYNDAAIASGTITARWSFYNNDAAAPARSLSNWRAPFMACEASSVLTSGATIAPTNCIHHVSGTAAVATITVPTMCAPTCTIYLIPDGAFTTTTAGNISLASTAVVNKVLIMVWDGTKWNPSY